MSIEPHPLACGPGAPIGACIAAANARDLEAWDLLVESSATLVAALDGVHTQTTALATQARALHDATSSLTLQAGWIVAVDPQTAVVELTVEAVTGGATFHIEGVAAKIEFATDARLRSVSLFLLDPSFGGAIAPEASTAVNN